MRRDKNPESETGGYKKELEGWIGRKSCRKIDLESLVGRLCHASRVMPDPSQASNHLTVTSSTAGLVDHKPVKEGCINVVGSNNNVAS